MSFSELVIVVLIGLIVLKPEDIPSVIKQVQNFFNYISSLRKEIEKEFLDATKSSAPEEIDNINFYMAKISKLGETYTGEYNLQSIKAFYHKLILKKPESRIEEDKK
jgi:Sec-independent protein translocase protein TatA